MEQGTGVGPALTAWEAAVIPIYQPCMRLTGVIIAQWGRGCKPFFDAIKRKNSCKIEENED